MKSVRINMRGKRFGRLIGIEPAGHSKDGHLKWLFQCDCGERTVAYGKYVRSGRTRSCGCLKKESIARVNASHRMCQTATYRTWYSMIGRCHNKNHSSYPKYGALGTKVCTRWRSSFENFLEDVGERPAGKTLDRIDPFGHYEPGNCVWSTPAQQSRNTRGRAAIEYLQRHKLGPFAVNSE